MTKILLSVFLLIVINDIIILFKLKSPLRLRNISIKSYSRLTYNPLPQSKITENEQHFNKNQLKPSYMRYSNTILHCTSFGEKEDIWREFLRFGEYISLDKFIHNTTESPHRASATEGLTTVVTHTENAKTELLT